MSKGRKDIPGIHHVTGISGPPRENVEFYTGFLGLRLVKKTVNFDDPATYHLYYGNGAGEPGTILTFFPWVDAYPGRAGAGMVTHTSFAVPEDSIDYWLDRFAERAQDFRGPSARFDEHLISFAAPDGLLLELIADPSAGRMEGWSDVSASDPVAVEHSVRGFFGATLGVRDHDRTARLLTAFGYEVVGEEGTRMRLAADGWGLGRHLDLVVDPEGPRPRLGTGTIHHIAFRARDEEEQLAWRETIVDLGFDVTPVMDRNYFKSIYFREPNGVLFEIATDPPGFTADEPLETLGTALKLPDWLEPRREMIERHLVPL